jgi:putative spermidine/putrescine transport system substrate-binding protein
MLFSKKSYANKNGGGFRPANLLTCLALAGLVWLAAGCQSLPAGAPGEMHSTASFPPSPGPSQSLIAAAQAEGALTAIALPDDWCSYGEQIRSFEERYGIPVTVLNPYGSSGDELEAVRQQKEDPGLELEAPDVLDVGHAFGPAAKAEGLLAPYQASGWESIPSELKDPEGYWAGGYYGVLAFEVNADVVENIPQDWEDLLAPEYRGQVALAGDPLSSTQAILSVYAAALANGGSLDDARPGLEFFRQLHEAGNFVPLIADAPQIIDGSLPITIRWDYLALGDRDALRDQVNIEVVIPRSGVLAGLYVTGISAYAPHPNAARLWVEHLYSDWGQLLWLQGYCRPIRFDDLVARNVIPQNLMTLLPPASLYRQAEFPSLEQQDAAQQLIVSEWEAVVGVPVTRP